MVSQVQITNVSGFPNPEVVEIMVVRFQGFRFFKCSHPARSRACFELRMNGASAALEFRISRLWAAPELHKSEV